MREIVKRESLKKFAGHHDTDDDNSFDHCFAGVLNYALINGGYDLQLKSSFLRQQAEAKLSKRKKSPATETDTQRLIHELEVHQIELEMQNEALLQANAELESTLSQYAELYAFASEGYFTLTRDDTIHRANLTAEKLMGVVLSELIKRCFAVFISPESGITSSPFLDRAFTSGNKETAKSRSRCIILIILDETCQNLQWIT